MPLDPRVPLDRLKLAFTLYVARKIVNADDHVHPDEAALLHRAIPPDELELFGFLEPGTSRLTPGFHAAAREALDVLPLTLSRAEKLRLIEWFRGVCLVDGTVHPREAELLAQARLALGLSAAKAE